MYCTVCSFGDPEVCCFTCDETGLPYHEACWGSQPLHIQDRNPPHRRDCISEIPYFQYVNSPNKRTYIEDKVYQEDDVNCFIELNYETQKFQFGPRAHPLLPHHQDPQSKYPSFVSFVGRAMSGKSFLLRALLHGGALDEFPAPIPAPGEEPLNYSSTSSDIHLYPDWRTFESESPILFLDCEGFEGSELPSSLKAKFKLTAGQKKMRPGYVENAYPRLVYAFSTCIVFVTSGQLAEATKIGERLLSYASQGAVGSQNQGFKPSLFIVFNRFQGDNIPSVDESTRTFLDHEHLSDLRLFYDAISVIYVPPVQLHNSSKGLSQIGVLRTLLYEEHERAFTRRREFRLLFTPDKLVHHLWRALDLFSQSHNSVFDWASETARQGSGHDDVLTRLRDLWTQYAAYYRRIQTASNRDRYDLTHKAFVQHVQFCLQIRLTRHPVYGEHVGVIPKSLDELVAKIEELLSEYAPCVASHLGTECEELKKSHADHHQGQANSAKALRWSGCYEASESGSSQTFRAFLESTLGGSDHNISLDEFVAEEYHREILSTTSCFGCLQGPPGTFLSCGHALCHDCVYDIAKRHGLEPHRATAIKCPFHCSSEAFSPRILPDQSGFRILSLDGGGVKGMAQLTILRTIEKKCLGIPIAQLFDLIVGTNVGGQIALALTTPAQPTVDSATEKIRELLSSSHVCTGFRKFSIVRRIFQMCAYETEPLEDRLRSTFGHDVKLCSAVSQWSPPHVAVTTVSQTTLEAHLLANYNRRPSPDACSILLNYDPNECLSTWVAARCTSAAMPYFPAFDWQGLKLLDGSFRLSCPAATAHKEATSIWPEKHCDIMLSLGTGRPRNNARWPPNNLQCGQKVVDIVASSERAWNKFVAGMEGNLSDHGIFRLNPEYFGNGYDLDAFKKLDSIESEAALWLESCDEISRVCDRLIAALFFFVPTSLTDGELNGGIFCRLPVDLEARNHLVGAMQQHSDVFEVRVIGNSRKPIMIPKPENLPHIRAGEELCIPVFIDDLPLAGKIDIDIRMRSVKCSPWSESPCWSPIGGSPYVLREDEMVFKRRKTGSPM